MNAPLRFGEPTEVADGVWAIPTDYPEAADAPLWVHLLRGPGSWSIVDCGVPTTWASCFEPAFARIGLDASEIEWLLLTHGHPDHMGGHPTLQPHAHAKVAAPLEDVIWVESVDRQWKNFWDRFPGTMPTAPIKDWVVDMCGGDLPVDRILRDGEVFEAAGRTLTVVQTRGHTRGHCALFEEATGVLLCGDAVQGHGIEASSGTSAFAPLYEDVDDAIAGLERLKALPFTLLAGAHFYPLEREAGLKLLDDSIAFIHETDQLVRRLVSVANGPISIPDVATAIGRTTGTVPPVAMQTIYTAAAHLEHLARQGELEPRYVRTADQPESEE
jgi:glyoxylase-like metal-dependent hydrolase (beta-lactamase superfamily II)